MNSKAVYNSELDTITCSEINRNFSTLFSVLSSESTTDNYP